MGVEVVTKEDLQEFRLQLLNDIKELINNKETKKWIKTHEVLALLDISDVTLQSLRNRGIIPFKKLGGICYYNQAEIETVMQNL